MWRTGTCREYGGRGRGWVTAAGCRSHPSFLLRRTRLTFFSLLHPVGASVLCAVCIMANHLLIHGRWPASEVQLRGRVPGSTLRNHLRAWLVSMVQTVRGCGFRFDLGRASALRSTASWPPLRNQRHESTISGQIAPGMWNRSQINYKP